MSSSPQQFSSASAQSSTEVHELEEAEEPVGVKRDYTEDELVELVDRALSGHRLERTEVTEQEMSFKLLDRLDRIITSHHSNQRKQVALAKVYAALIGIAVPSEKWALEKIGNRLKSSLAEHNKRLKKARHGKSATCREAARCTAENRIVAWPFAVDKFKRVLTPCTEPKEPIPDFLDKSAKKRRSTDQALVDGSDQAISMLLAASMSVPDTTPRIIDELPLEKAVIALAKENIIVKQLPLDVHRQITMRRAAQTQAAQLSLNAKLALRDAEVAKRAAEKATALAHKASTQAAKKAARADAQVKHVDNLKAERERLNTKVAAAHMEAWQAIKKKDAEVAKLTREKNAVFQKLEIMRNLKNHANARARKAEKDLTRSQLYLERAQEAEAAVRELQQEYDALHEMYGVHWLPRYQ